MFGNDTTTIGLIQNFINKNCIGQKSCYIDPVIDLQFVQMLSCSCKSQILNSITSNYLMMAYQCSSDTISILNSQSSQAQVTFSRSSFLWWYVIIDIGGVLIIIYLFTGLKLTLDKRFSEIQRNLIEAKDFTI